MLTEDADTVTERSGPLATEIIGDDDPKSQYVEIAFVNTNELYSNPPDPPAATSPPPTLKTVEAEPMPVNSTPEMVPEPDDVIKAPEMATLALRLITMVEAKMPLPLSMAAPAPVSVALTTET